MTFRHLTTILCAALTLAACETPTPNPPRNLAEYDQSLKVSPPEFTPLTIMLYNVNRVLSPSLLADSRVSSLQVIERLDLADDETLSALSGLLGQSDTPEPLRTELVAYLARKGYGGAETVAMPVTSMPADSRTKLQILDYIEQHPTPTALDDVVKLWAAEKSPKEADEVRYRRAVEKIAQKPWDAVLLDALNTRDFTARGSAMELLANRLQAEQLLPRIAALKAQTDAVQALQFFADNFGYLPRTKSELLATAILFKEPPEQSKLAARAAAKWAAEGNYRFNIRDYHLLSRIAADPLRTFLPRKQLQDDIRAFLAVQRTAPAAQKRMGRVVDFDAQADTLTLADLWNIMLLNHVLNRPRAQEAFKVMAQRDRADTQTQWAGLITYDQGQAEAKLYTPAEKRGDQEYVPTEAMLRDAKDSLCYFIGHFDRDYDDPAQTGPTDDELRLIREQNIYGLVLTSLKDGRINAAYFNPAGAVIDLGDFPAGR